MLMTLAQWLQTVSPDFGFLRVFQYLTFRALMAALTALLLGLAAEESKRTGLPVDVGKLRADVFGAER